MKLYNTPALAALLYSGEKWTIKARDARRITAAEIKCKRQDILGTDYKTNTQIAKELNVTPVLDKIQEYMGNWVQHENSMPHNITEDRKKKTRPNGAKI
jgi:hypothetical protein